jgi:hypothetical protein
VSRSSILLVPLLALAPASAGAGALRDPVSLTAVPAHVALGGSGSATVRIRNSGTRRVAVDVAPAGFALDLRGRPHIVGRRGGRSAVSWLTLRPSHFTLGPRAAASLVVSASVPDHAEPGDHDALVLVTTRPLSGARVAVRLRLGVVVVVRAPGTVVRRLRLGPLRLSRRSRGRALELLVVNGGNVTEQLRHARVVLSRLPKKRRLLGAAAVARELRPHTRGLLEFRLRTAARGPVAAHVIIPSEAGRRAVARTYHLRI